MGEMDKLAERLPYRLHMVKCSNEPDITSENYEKQKRKDGYDYYYLYLYAEKKNALGCYWEVGFYQVDEIGHRSIAFKQEADALNDAMEKCLIYLLEHKLLKVGDNYDR